MVFIFIAQNILFTNHGLTRSFFNILDTQIPTIKGVVHRSVRLPVGSTDRGNRVIITLHARVLASHSPIQCINPGFVVLCIADALWVMGIVVICRRASNASAEQFTLQREQFEK